MDENKPILEELAKKSKQVRDETGTCPHSDEGDLFPSMVMAPYCPFNGAVKCEYEGRTMKFYGLDRYGKMEVVPLNICMHSQAAESGLPNAAD